MVEVLDALDALQQHLLLHLFVIRVRCSHAASDEQPPPLNASRDARAKRGPYSACTIHVQVRGESRTW